MSCSLIRGLSVSCVLIAGTAWAQQAPPQPAPGGDAPIDVRPGRGGDRGPDGRRDRGPEGRGDRGPGQGVLDGPMGRVSQSVFRPSYMTRDTPMFIEILELDKSQGDIVMLLLEDYDANFRMAAEEAKAAMGDLWTGSGVEDMSRQAMERVREEGQALREEIRELRQEFAVNGPNGQGDDQEMTEEQRAEAQAMQEKRQTLREEMRERMQAIRAQARDARHELLATDEMQDVLTKQIAILRSFDGTKRRMADETSGAIIAMLSEEQASQWPTVDRAIRRMRHLPDGRLSGESTDLSPLVTRTLTDLEPETQAKVDAVVGAWETNIDGALADRARFDQNAVFDALEAMQARDFESIVKVLDRRYRYAKSVRDVTDEAIDAVAYSLPEDRVQDFRLEALRMGYGSVYRPARSQRAIGAALELEGLDAETLEQVAQLGQACDLDIAEENEAVLEATRDHERSREYRFVRRMADREAGVENDDSDPIDDARAHRNEVDEDYLERLRDLIGEERVNELPGGRQRQQGMNRGEGRGRGNDMDREERRQQFMQRFDTDGDGEISDAEREKIREFFEQMRGERGDRGGEGRGGRGGQRGGPQGRGGDGGGQQDRPRRGGSDT